MNQEIAGSFGMAEFFCPMSAFSSLFIVEEDVLVVFQKCLHSHLLCLHVVELALYVQGPHDSGRENDSEIERGHLVRVSCMSLDLELNSSLTKLSET